MQKHLNRRLKLIFIFLISYILLYSLGIFTSNNPIKIGDKSFAFHSWGFTPDLSRLDYLYFLIPIPGFFFAYYIIDWINKYFETELAYSIAFPILLVVTSFFSFYVALFWFHCNFADFSSESFCTSLGMQRTTEYLSNSLWNLYFDSAFAVFVLSAVFGWGTKVLLKRFEGK